VEHYDEQFEKYLGEFQPRRPRALPEAVGLQRVWARRLAAAAIAVALGASVWWLHGRKDPSRNNSLREETIAAKDRRSATQKLSIAELTQMALQDPERFDAELSEASRRMLPGFQGRESTLRVLAKE
jgi:hypothetical protein